MVFMTKEDFENLIKEQVQAMMAVNTAAMPTDISTKGEPVRPLLVNGVKYLTRTDTARLLGKSFPTLFRYNRDGILQSVKMGPRSVYYRYDDVVRMLGGTTPAVEICEKGGVA